MANRIVLNTIFAFLYFFTRDSIDDKLENIEAAREAKINGIVYDYNNHEQLLEELDKYDVNYR